MALEEDTERSKYKLISHGAGDGDEHVCCVVSRERKVQFLFGELTTDQLTPEIPFRRDRSWI